MENRPLLVNIVGLRLLPVKLVYNLLKSRFTSTFFESIKQVEEDERIWKKITLEFLKTSVIKQDSRISPETMMSIIQSVDEEMQIMSHEFDHKARECQSKGLSFVSFNGAGWWELGNFECKLPTGHLLGRSFQRKSNELTSNFGYDLTLYLRMDVSARRLKIADRWAVIDPTDEEKEKLSLYLKRMANIYEEKAKRMGDKCVKLNFPEDWSVQEMQEKAIEILTERGLR